jgi:Calcium-activated chloride channel
VNVSLICTAADLRLSVDFSAFTFAIFAQRSVQSHENSLVMKRFSFAFCSNYSSLFYIAFVKPFTPTDPCTPRYAAILGDAIPVPDCMAELETQLITLLLTKATVQQIIEVGIPFVAVAMKKWQLRETQRSMNEELTDAERMQLTSAGGVADDENDKSLAQSKLAKYRSEEASLDMVELALQFGFFAMFGMAAPITALINLVNNVVETRTDAFKILVVSQRPDAADASDIGSWLTILDFMYGCVALSIHSTSESSPSRRHFPIVCPDAKCRLRLLSFVLRFHARDNERNLESKVARCCWHQRGFDRGNCKFVEGGPSGRRGHSPSGCISVVRASFVCRAQLHQGAGQQDAGTHAPGACPTGVPCRALVQHWVEGAFQSQSGNATDELKFYNRSLGTTCPEGD